MAPLQGLHATSLELYVPVDALTTHSMISRHELLHCLASLSYGGPPWIAVFGDSLARGVFFDVVSILNGSYTAGRGPESVHPGHSANYSSGCQLYERRPPLDRLKCGAFNYEYPLGGTGTRARHVEVTGTLPTRQHPDHDILQLSFRLKTFAWEPRFDEEWFRTLRSIPKLPTVLLLGFGVWDMQYPAGGTPEAGVDAFEDALKTFLGRLEQTLRTKLRAIARAKGVPVRRLRKPRIYWLTVAAISSSKLPDWKKPRMNAGLAQRYNDVARPQLQRRGIEIIDTFSSTLANPLLSIDGVHFPGVVSKHHAQLFLRATCMNFMSDRQNNQNLPLTLKMSYVPRV